MILVVYSRIKKFQIIMNFKDINIRFRSRVLGEKCYYMSDMSRVRIQEWQFKNEMSMSDWLRVTAHEWLDNIDMLKVTYQEWVIKRGDYQDWLIKIDW